MSSPGKGTGELHQRGDAPVKGAGKQQQPRVKESGKDNQRDSQRDSQREGHVEGGGGKGSSEQGKAKGSSKAVVVIATPPPHRLAVFDGLRTPPALAPVSSSELAPLHPSTIKLGLLLKSGAIYDDDDRATALLLTLCDLIQAYTTPPNNSISRDLDRHVKLQVKHIVECRSLCTGMGSIIKFLRHRISQLLPEQKESDAKSALVEELHQFREDKILYARQSIVTFCVPLIRSGDTVLTFGYSAAVVQILRAAATTTSFKLIVVDARPLCDGKKTVKALPQIHCCFVPLSGTSGIMSSVTRVILGTSAVLSNGALLASAGTATIASIARTRRVPVIAVCESFKFTEKTQLDAIVHNELGSASEVLLLTDSGELAAQQGTGYRGGSATSTDLPIEVVNLRYDLTPASLISLVVTETGLIPPSSIPVLLREIKGDASDA